MGDRSCQHLPLRDVPPMRLLRCTTHSALADGGAVWTWGPVLPSPGACPCARADRFVVATETATPSWLYRADVVSASRRETAGAAGDVAVRLGRIPGCALVTVPFDGLGVLFRTATETVVLDRGGPGACGLCVYPWLVAGRRLLELTAPPLGSGAARLL